MRDILFNIFGSYQPLTYSAITYNASGTAIDTTCYVSGLAGLDWPWIASVFLFGLVLFCFFRLLGGVLK